MVITRKSHASVLRCALADSRGGAAIEFALCGTAFLALLVATFQIVLVFFAQQSIQTATEAVARRVLTGQITATNTSKAQFKNAACAQLPAYMACSRLFVDVRRANDFNGIDTSLIALTYDAAGNINNNWQFDPGSSGDVVILRLLYLWPVTRVPMGFNIGNQTNGARLVIGTMVFKSEPF
jgi:Flp pilus assembly protein TadG